MQHPDLASEERKAEAQQDFAKLSTEYDEARCCGKFSRCENCSDYSGDQVDINKHYK